MKTIVILGSTGSIGTSTLDIVDRFPEEFRVAGLTAGSNDEKLEAQIRRFKPRVVALSDASAAARLRQRCAGLPVEILAGQEGLIQVASAPEAELVISAIVGGAGLVPTLAAIRSGKQIALANKEPMVMAGKLMQDEARRHGVRIFPVDSEHSAIFQSLEGHRKEDVRRLILTASGGALWTLSREELQDVTPERALQHPNWKMGAKITIDSATLMNKGSGSRRSPVALRYPGVSDRGHDPSGKHHSFSGRICGPFHDRAVGIAGYANTYFLCDEISRAHAAGSAFVGSDGDREVDVLQTGSRPVPLLGSRL